MSKFEAHLTFLDFAWAALPTRLINPMVGSAQIHAAVNGSQGNERMNHPGWCVSKKNDENDLVDGWSQTRAKKDSKNIYRKHRLWSTFWLVGGECYFFQTWMIRWTAVKVYHNVDFWWLAIMWFGLNEVCENKPGFDWSIRIWLQDLINL